MSQARPRWVAVDRYWHATTVTLAVACAGLLVVAAGCQQSSGVGGAAPADDEGADGAALIGEPPTARASSSAYGFVFPGTEVALSGSGSDPDQGDEDPDPVVRWFQVAGTQVELTGADTPEAAFTVPDDVIPGESLGFELRVTDADGNTTSDWVYLFIPRDEAVLLAIGSGPDEPVAAGAEVTLSSAGSLNLPAETAIFQWRPLESGPEVELEGADSPTATFIAPDPGAAEITLTFRLTIKNGQMAAEDLVEVIVVPVGEGEPGPEEPGEEEPPEGDPVAGEAAYAAAGCGNCHGADAGGEPNLQGPGQLPAMEERFGGGGNHFGATLSDTDILDVAAWLATLGDQAGGDDGADGGDTPPAEAGPCDVPGAEAGEGEAAYGANICAACHQADASGSIGPALRGDDRTAALEERFLPEGTAHNGATLTEDEVRDLACWFSSLEP
ncbi:MAG TPA: hypothetical protein VM243_17760 [Phycisphaerae bacterium]|nr:hypothetical protein [Phycisphaerae bacterium]